MLLPFKRKLKGIKIYCQKALLQQKLIKQMPISLLFLLSLKTVTAAITVRQKANIRMKPGPGS